MVTSKSLTGERVVLVHCLPRQNLVTLRRQRAHQCLCIHRTFQNSSGTMESLTRLLRSTKSLKVGHSDTMSCSLSPPSLPPSPLSLSLSSQSASLTDIFHVGINKKDAQLLFIRGMYETELHGVIQVPAILADGQNVMLAVGAKSVRIYNSRGTIIKK